MADLRSGAAVALVATVLGLAPSTALASSDARALPSAVPAPVAGGGAHLLATRPGSASMRLNVALEVRESSELDALIEAASTPGSPRYGDYLTEDQYMTHFAPTASQLAAVQSWLRGRGLHVMGASKDDLLVYVESPTAAVERAFGVKIGEYAAEDRRFFAPESAPTLAASLPVLSVSGLSDYERPTLQTVCHENLCGYTGNEMRTAYDVSGDAEGQTLAFTAWGKPLPESDYEQYAALTGTPVLKIGAGAEHIEFKEVDGASSADTEQEVGLDTEAAHVIAPGAHEVYWLAKEGEDPELEQALSEAANSSATVISNSWGKEGENCEGPGGSGSGIETTLQHGAALGKTFFFAAGDRGAESGCTYPAASQYVVAVGGTSLEVGEHGEWKREQAITDGGNCDNRISRPSWQTGAGVAAAKVYPTGACVGRVTPDVSALSCYSREAPYEFGTCFLEYLDDPEYSEHTTFASGGTSLATPIWAAGTAVWNEQNALTGRPGVGFLAPLLYTLGNDPTTYARDFHDITEGGNGFAATTGWDEASGWGSPIFAGLDSNEGTLTLSATNPTEGPEGGSVTFGAQLQDKGGSEALAGRAVQFAVGADSCETTTNASGVASCAIAINAPPGKYTLSAHAAATASYVASTAESSFAILAEPVFGRCLKVSGEKVGKKSIYHGGYTSSSCTKTSAAHEGKYEWAPGPNAARAGFSLAIKSGATVKVETAGRSSLVCTGADGSGTITGLREAELSLKLTGCSDGDEKCTSDKSEGEVLLSPLQGTLGWEEQAAKKVAIKLHASGEQLLAYECSNKRVTLDAPGILLPLPADKSATSATLKLVERKGRQAPDALEGESPLTSQEERVIVSPPSTTTEPAGIAAALVQSYEEPYEVNAAY